MYQAAASSGITSKLGETKLNAVPQIPRRGSATARGGDGVSVPNGKWGPERDDRLERNGKEAMTTLPRAPRPSCLYIAKSWTA